MEEDQKVKWCWQWLLKLWKQHKPQEIQTHCNWETQVAAHDDWAKKIQTPNCIILTETEFPLQQRAPTMKKPKSKRRQSWQLELKWNAELTEQAKKLDVHAKDKGKCKGNPTGGNDRSSSISLTNWVRLIKQIYNTCLTCEGVKQLGTTLQNLALQKAWQKIKWWTSQRLCQSEQNAQWPQCKSFLMKTRIIEMKIKPCQYWHCQSYFGQAKSHMQHDSFKMMPILHAKTKISSRTTTITNNGHKEGNDPMKTVNQTLIWMTQILMKT